MRSSQVESQGGWTGKTHDAVWDNIQQYLPEIDNLYKGCRRVGYIVRLHSTRPFSDQVVPGELKQAYDKDKAAYPHFADTIEQNYSGAAQQVMAKVYVPGIQFIRDNNPAFSGPTPKLTDLIRRPLRPPPPPSGSVGSQGHLRSGRRAPSTASAPSGSVGSQGHLRSGRRSAPSAAAFLRTCRRI